MKRKSIFILALFGLILSASFWGCQKPEETPQPQIPDADEVVEEEVEVFTTTVEQFKDTIALRMTEMFEKGEAYYMGKKTRDGNATISSTGTGFFEGNIPNGNSEIGFQYNSSYNFNRCGLRRWNDDKGGFSSYEVWFSDYTDGNTNTNVWKVIVHKGNGEKFNNMLVNFSNQSWMQLLHIEDSLITEYEIRYVDGSGIFISLDFKELTETGKYSNGEEGTYTFSDLDEMETRFQALLLSNQGTSLTGLPEFNKNNIIGSNSPQSVVKVLVEDWNPLTGKNLMDRDFTNRAHIFTPDK